MPITFFSQYVRIMTLMSGMAEASLFQVSGLLSGNFLYIYSKNPEIQVYSAVPGGSTVRCDRLPWEGHPGAAGPRDIPSSPDEHLL